MRVSDAPYIKCIDPPEDNPYPGTRVIARPFMPDHESNALVWKGAAGADDWFALWLEWMRRRSYAYAFEGPNESHPMADATFRRRLDAFTVRLASLFTAERLRLVGMNWSVGWPNIDDAPDFAKSVRALYNGGHILGLHEYSARAMWDGEGYYCLRYRRTVDELREAGVPIPRILIGETGIDGGVIDRPKTGWRNYASEDEYLIQLAWYDNELMQDDYILAATIFTVCGWDWHSFNINESMGMKIARYVATHPSPIAPPEPPTPPPPPPPNLWSEVADHVQQIADLVETMAPAP